MVTNAELKKEFDELKVIIGTLNEDLASKIDELSASFEKRIGLLENKISKITNKSDNNDKEIFYLIEKVERLEDKNKVLVMKKTKFLGKFARAKMQYENQNY